MELGELKARAIIGNIRNMSDDCLNRPRPRAQYIHFWRSIKKKIVATLPEIPEGPLKVIVGDLGKILEAWPKPVNTDSPEISKACLDYLMCVNM
jgi:hypothetical protein